MMTMMHLLLLLLCVLTRWAEIAAQSAEDTAVVNLMVERTTSAANRIDSSESIIFLASRGNLVTVC